MLTMECNQVLPNPPTTTAQYFCTCAEDEVHGPASLQTFPHPVMC